MRDRFIIYTCLGLSIFYTIFLMRKVEQYIDATDRHTYAVMISAVLSEVDTDLRKVGRLPGF